MDFVIVSPCGLTHASAGIRALTILRDELEAHGHNAEVVQYDPTKRCYDHVIAVYPETIPGNPLEAKRVIRWCLNKPGFLGGDETYDPSEYVVTWSTDYIEAPLLTVETMERHLFNADDLPPKTFDTAYYGKAGKDEVQRSYKTMHMPEINATWPPTREDTADLLRRTRTFWSYDHNTALMREALACGCEVIRMPQCVAMTQGDADPDAIGAMDHASRLDALLIECDARWGDWHH